MWAESGAPTSFPLGARQVEDYEKAMADAKEGISTLMEELAALAAGIKALDKSVAEATETRQEENAEYKDTMAANKAAKELLGVAKNRLAKFYTPKLYKVVTSVELRTLLRSGRVLKLLSSCVFRAD